MLFSSKRRGFLFYALRNTLATLAALAFTGASLAQAQPADMTRLLVGFPAGGGSDVIARLLADKLKDELHAPVVVENRGGAGGQIAAQVLKAAAPDGHTLFLTHDHTISILPLVVKNPGFDPATDFVAVAGFATFTNALAVSGGTPAHTFKEYVDWVRQHKGGRDAIGVPAPASIPDFLVKLIGDKFKLDMQSVPYRGSAPMMSDMLGNQISAGIGSIPDFIENQKAGKIRVIAVIGNKRDALLPGVPTFGELGLAGLDDHPFYGIYAPRGTPQPMVDRFGAALAKVIALPEVKERLSAMGLSVGYMPQAQFTARERNYTRTWAKIIKASGYQPQ